MDEQAADEQTARPEDEQTPVVVHSHAQAGPPVAAQAAQPSDRLGRNSMYLAITVFVASSATSILLGLFGTTIYDYQQTVLTNGQETSSRVGFNAVADPLISLLQGGLGTLLGVTAIVLGIVAVVQRRGRGFGVAAIVIAAVAPVASLLLFLGFGMAFGHHVSQ